MNGAVKLISARGVSLVQKRMDLELTGVTKFVASGKRRIRGLASTDTLDRQGDIVDPRGGTWSLPVPLLFGHDHSVPVGWVRSVEVRGNGLWIEAEFAEGVGRADEIWSMVDKGLISTYSIGFRPITTEPLRSGGLKFAAWELLEISVVVVPANPDARIQRNAAPVSAHHALRRTGPVRLTLAPIPLTYPKD